LAGIAKIEFRRIEHHEAGPHAHGDRKSAERIWQIEER